VRFRAGARGRGGGADKKNPQVLDQIQEKLTSGRGTPEWDEASSSKLLAYVVLKAKTRSWCWRAFRVASLIMSMALGRRLGVSEGGFLPGPVTER